MPIYYSKDEGGWLLKDVTPDEVEQLTEIGKQAAVQMLGAAIIKQYQEHVLQNGILESLPKEEMAQG